MKKLVLTVVLGVFLSVVGVVHADDVYVTPRGSKYHKEICRLVKNSKTVDKYELKEAEGEGYTACRRCFKKSTSEKENETKKVEKIK